MAIEVVVDRREPREARRLRFARRREQAQQRGQQRERGEQCDEHPDARDQAQLGHAAIGGRDEREEARRDGRGGQRERHAHRVRGADQRVIDARIAEALLAVLHAVLDREVDAEADEQHHERDRDHVQRTDHREAECGGHDEADEQRDQHRADHPLRAQCQPQDDEHGEQREDAVERRAVFDRREFVVGERLLAGQAHGRAEALLEVERAGRVADHLAGFRAGFQRAVVDHGLHGDERARGLPRGIVVDQCAPRERGRLAGQHVVDRRGAACEQLRHRGQFHLAGQQRLAERGGQRRGEPGQARVLREFVDERARARELRGGIGDVLRRQEQQPVVLEERPAAGLGDLADAAGFGVLPQRFGQRMRGGIREFGRGRLDDREDRAVALRERFIDGVAERGKLRFRVDELADVGVDLEMLGDIDAAERGDDERQHDDPDGSAYRPCNESDDERCHHVAVGSGWQGQSSQVYRRGVAAVVTLGVSGREGDLFVTAESIPTSGRFVRGYLHKRRRAASTCRRGPVTKGPER
ncbi:hypothetical protein BLA15945_06369 [Burkholderia lata]|uniref:Uncharacterized protein n=1 Tax=Burkholderia lata (strain ATCC 17760 / DSM 23089 / LMG 22485 / NCIMB 9086 / R18194 / 383) TaxID=482957 RepID=A0A6P2R9I7_BURL3|nr:hypothetical protein BLA15945_06369 [Burkholderia lata]